jgi:hypothetical protein
MATVQRYVNTAADGTGDGTTNATTGATGAYLSLSSWEANAGGSATDDYIVDCCGTAADTTGVTIDFSPNLTTGTVTVQGNRSDGAGFYDGNVVISDQHYRLDVGNVTICLSIAEPNATVDGIQLVPAHSTTARAGIVYTTSGAWTVRKCRLLNAGGVDIGIGNSAAIAGSNTINVENNLIVGFDVEVIALRAGTLTTPTYNVLHNTVYGDGSSIGIQVIYQQGAGVANIKGNAIANGGAGADISVTVGSGPATINYADNATEDFDLGTTNEIDLGNPTDAWTSPGTTAASDFTVKNTSSALYNAVNPTLVSTDITDFTRDGTNHDVGAFELVVAGGTRPKHLAMLGVS